MTAVVVRTLRSRDRQCILTAVLPQREGVCVEMSDNEVLVVASKVKNYIKDRGDMKTSSAVLNVLSDKIRGLCSQAIENARNDGRKTVLDRDFM